jgi:hypothetical protein
VGALDFNSESLSLAGCAGPNAIARRDYGPRSKQLELMIYDGQQVAPEDDHPPKPKRDGKINCLQHVVESARRSVGTTT